MVAVLWLPPQGRPGQGQGMQTAAQYSPEQLIEAGRRAEATGQFGYAQQFYRFLAEQFPQTAEGQEARDALYRLSQPSPEAPPARTHTLSAPPSPSPGGFGDLRAVRADAGPSAAAPRTAPRRHVESEVEFDPGAFIPPRAYRIGRFVAAMLNAIGWLTLLLVLVLVPTMMAALTLRSFPRGLRETISGNVLVFGAGTVGLLFLGLFAVFAAQVARATFDTADGVRWLAQRDRDRQ
jgi:hypothetical protein